MRDATVDPRTERREDDEFDGPAYPNEYDPVAPDECELLATRGGSRMAGFVRFSDACGSGERWKGGPRRCFSPRFIIRAGCVSRTSRIARAWA